MSKLTVTLELPNTSKKNLITHLGWVCLLLKDNYPDGGLYEEEERKGKWASDYEK